MEFKRDINGIIYVQNKPKERYKTLYHRINKGKYEMYYKKDDLDIILSDSEMIQYGDWLKELKIEDGKQKNKE